jgi:hypothetical protein
MAPAPRAPADGRARRRASPLQASRLGAGGPYGQAHATVRLCKLWPARPRQAAQDGKPQCCLWSCPHHAGAHPAHGASTCYQAVLLLATLACAASHAALSRTCRPRAPPLSWRHV